jgi:acyl-CoA-binding protein
MRRIAVIVFCLIAAKSHLLLAQGSHPCSREEEIKALTEASTLQEWAEIYRSYKQFAHCDDGAISEGYSDSVARLLYDHWESIDQLSRIASRDRAFERFVLAHIDQLLERTQAEKVLRNATSSCPPTAKRLCGSLAAKTRYLLRNWKEPPK